jgi:hypothetical protein
VVFGSSVHLLFIAGLMLLAQVVGPVDDVEEEEGTREKHPSDDIDFLGAELEVLRPFQQRISPSHGDFAVQHSTRWNHW